jgi:hypothetical protein
VVYPESTGGDPLAPLPFVSDYSTGASFQEGGFISLQRERERVPTGESENSAATITSIAANTLSSAEPVALVDSSELAPSLRELSGEWARAGVFEIAGGEPIAASIERATPQAAPFSAPDLNAAQPSANPPSETEKSSRFDASARGAADRGTPKEQVSKDANNVLPIDASLSTSASDDLATAQLETAVLQNTSQSRDNLSGKLPTASPATTLAAFEQLGEGRLALPSSFSDNLRLNHWLGSAPLLLIIALERMTARSSRRQRKTDGTIEVGDPRN